MKILYSAFLIIFLFLFACKKNDSSVITMERNQNQPTTECSNLYPYKDIYINLDNLQLVEVDVLPAKNFTTCSKYAYRFENPITDSIQIANKSFTIEKNRDKGIYNLNILKENKLIKTIKLPVENPLPEVQDYSISLLKFQNNVIVIIDDMYSTLYTVCKYDSNGKQLMHTKIEHTFITHPDPKTNYYHRYLYFNGIIGSQMIFTSHPAFAEKDKTIVLSLIDFSEEEYDFTANGFIPDETEQKLAGFISRTKKNINIKMLDNREFNFKLDYVDNACECLLKGDFLYISNYCPISTGANLQCFDLSSGKILWTADVKQPMIAHSEYYNKVTLSMYKDKLIMEGNEAYLDYVQIFEAKTGKNIAVFGDFSEVK